MTTQGAPTRLRLSIQADQLSSVTGGGRFIKGFLNTIFTDTTILNRFGHIYIVATQNESISSLLPLPSNVSIVRRRFPSRLRNTPLARLFKYTVPSVDVAYGPFFHVFPARAKSRVVTVHDMSFCDRRYHPQQKVCKTVVQMASMAQECDGVVCDSYTTLGEFQSRWPHLAHKAIAIYSGVSLVGMKQMAPNAVRDRSILAVGTIEPRKNYPTILDAFEQLVAELRDDAPVLTVAGNIGWMSESVGRRLMALQASGRCRWLRNFSDEQLADAYGKAGAFTYMSLCEGFGYPPFEAALARCPMILSNASSVGEIWSRHARCVSPLDVAGIVAGWKWALALRGAEREAVLAAQEKRALEFTWSRALNEYLAFWEELARR